MTALELAALAVLGAILFLDQWPAFQTMASRPIVTGVLVGTILGRPAEGALWGAVFEAIFLGVLPVGAARYPDVALATVAGTTVALLGREDELYPAGLAILAAVVAGRFGEWADHAQRRWNGRTAARVRERVATGDPEGLSGAVAAALARGAALGAVQTALVVAAGVALGRLVGASPWSAPLPPRGVAVAALGAAVVGGARLFAPRRTEGARRAAAWGVGVVAGLGLALWALRP